MFLIADKIHRKLNNVVNKHCHNNAELLQLWDISKNLKA